MLMTRVPRALLYGTLCLCLAGLSPDDSPAVAALAKLRSLAGDWQGSFEWTGARTDSGKMNVSYSVTGYRSAVVEGGESRELIELARMKSKPPAGATP